MEINLGVLNWGLFGQLKADEPDAVSDPGPERVSGVLVGSGGRRDRPRELPLGFRPKLVIYPADVLSRPRVNGLKGGLNCQAAFAVVADCFLGFLVGFLTAG